MEKKATLQLNKAHWLVTVLGPGRRIGLWVQGCTIHCAGCVSQDTWPKDATKTIAVRDLVAWCKRTAGDALDGVTISGGEPFEQPDGLRALLSGLRAWRESAHLDFDILCYSGYPLATLERKRQSDPRSRRRSFGGDLRRIRRRCRRRTRDPGGSRR